MKNNESRFIYKQYPDATILALARKFHNAANIIDANTEIYSEPYITCMSFSVELYIKSLHAEARCFEKDIFETLNGGESFSEIFHVSLVKVKGHNLKNLYEILPRKTKKEIDSSYLKDCTLIRRYPDISVALEKIQSSFVDFRYVYEKHPQPFEVSTLKELAIFFEKFTNEAISPKC